MKVMVILLEFLVRVFFAWTVAYEVTLGTRLPAWWAPVLWAVVLVPVLLPSLPRWVRALRVPVRRPWFGLGVLVLALAWGALQLFTWFEDRDDYSLMHRVVWQQQHLDQPYALFDTGHGDPEVPALSILHVATSYEPLTGVIGHALSLNAVWVYQNGGAALAAAFFPVVLALLYRRFRLGPVTALAATATALAFMLADGGTWPIGGKSFGRMAVWLWPAKNMLWLVGLPLAFLWGLRFLARPTLGRYGSLVLLSAGALGMNNSGIYLVPGIWFCLSAAYVLGYGIRPRRLRRAVLLNIASFPCVIVAALLMTHIIPEPADRTVWSAKVGWPEDWWPNLQIVAGHFPRAVRDLLLLLVLAPAALTRPLRRLPVLLTLVTCATFLNPIAGPMWMRFVQGTFWRLGYLLPVPWAAGLAAGCLRFRRVQPALAAARVGALIAAIVALVVAFEVTALSSRMGVGFKGIRGYQFASTDAAFVRRLGIRLEGRLLLAPERMVETVGLLHPSVRVYAGFHLDTPHLFANAGRAEEGIERLRAQRFVTGQDSPTARAAFEQALERGVNAIVIPVELEHRVRPLLRRGENGPWHEAGRASGYVLWLRDS